MSYRALLIPPVIATILFGNHMSLERNAAADTSTSPHGRYLTIVLAHTAETATDNECNPVPGVETLEEQATQYQNMGLHGITATVVTNWPLPDTDNCIASYQLPPQPKPLLIASWSRMQALASTFGWSFVSNSRDYVDVTVLSTSDQQAQICGSASDLQQQSLPGSSGLFAYPNNHYTTAIQTNITDTCYSFGRTFTNPFNSLPIQPPYFVGTYSLNGGACNLSTLPCYSYPTRYHYTSPLSLASKVKPNLNKWSIVQGYRFLNGSGSYDSFSWDCTSADWHEHWTAGADASEFYCWSDWLYALNQIPKGTVTIDPATMATRFAVRQ